MADNGSVARMIYDDQPEMVQAALRGPFPLEETRPDAARRKLAAAFAAIDREALIEKAALGVARPGGPHMIQAGDRVKAEKVLVAAGIISPEPTNPRDPKPTRSDA